MNKGTRRCPRLISTFVRQDAITAQRYPAENLCALRGMLSNNVTGRSRRKLVIGMNVGDFRRVTPTDDQSRIEDLMRGQACSLVKTSRAL